MALFEWMSLLSLLLLLFVILSSLFAAAAAAAAAIAAVSPMFFFFAPLFVVATRKSGYKLESFFQLNFSNIDSSIRPKYALISRGISGLDLTNGSMPFKTSNAFKPIALGIAGKRNVIARLPPFPVKLGPTS